MKGFFETVRAHAFPALAFAAAVLSIRLVVLWSTLIYQWTGRGTLFVVTLIPLLYPEAALYSPGIEWTPAHGVSFSVLLAVGSTVGTVGLYAIVLFISHLTRVFLRRSCQ